MKKIALAVLLATIALHASATAQFTDRAAWNGATTVASLTDFEGIAAAGDYHSYGTSATINGLKFTANGNLYVLDSGFGTQYTTGTGAALYLDSTGSTVNIALGGAYSAFAIDLRGISGATDTIKITLGSEVFNVTSNNSSVFFGVVLSQAITSVSIKTSYYTAFDNIALGPAGNAVPEPASAALLGLGLLGLALARRKSVK